jgi:phenylacetate-CoA ligase
MHFNPHIQYEPEALQQAYQDEAVKKMLRHVGACSPYYKRLFSKHHINIDNIRSVADLNFIPTTSKEDLQTHNWEFMCVADRKIREYASTTGAMGAPVTVALTDADLERLTHSTHQVLEYAGGKAGDIYQLMVSMDKENLAGLSYYLGARKLGGIPVRVGHAHPSAQWQTIQRLQPSTLIALPSYLLKLAEWAIENGIDLKKSPPQKVICVGESIRRGDFEFNALGSKINELWPLQLYNSYGVTEMQAAFGECSAGAGVHIQPDLAIVEILNDRGDVLPAGEYGEVTITTIGVEGLPLLRYRTGDICSYHDIPCTCGRHTRRLSPVLGRKHQAMKYAGATLYPGIIYDLLSDAPFVGEYIVEAFTNELSQDDIKLHINSTLPAREAEARLRPILLDKLPAMPGLEVHTEDEIQKMQLPTGSQHRIRFMDNRYLA